MYLGSRDCKVCEKQEKRRPSVRTETVQKKDSSCIMNPFQLQQKEVQEFLLLLEHQKKNADVYKVTKTSLFVVDYKM